MEATTLVLEGNAIVRHVQLKATFRGSTVARFNVNARLALKPSGCVVVLLFEPRTLELGPFQWFGAPRANRSSTSNATLSRSTRRLTRGG